MELQHFMPGIGNQVANQVGPVIERHLPIKGVVILVIKLGFDPLEMLIDELKENKSSAPFAQLGQRIWTPQLCGLARWPIHFLSSGQGDSASPTGASFNQSHVAPLQFAHCLSAMMTLSNDDWMKSLRIRGTRILLLAADMNCSTDLKVPADIDVVVVIRTWTEIVSEVMPGGFAEQMVEKSRFTKAVWVHGKLIQ